MPRNCLTSSSQKAGGTIEEWRRVALDVLDNKYHKADSSLLNSILIGIRGFPEFAQAKNRIETMLKKK